MPLSLVIEQCLQIIYLSSGLISVVKPIFFEHRLDVVHDHILHPLLTIFCLIAEIAMTDAKTSTKGIVFLDCHVQLFDSFNDIIKLLTLQSCLIFLESIGIKARAHIEETEPTAQSIVYHSQRTVGSIHHTYNI